MLWNAVVPGVVLLGLVIFVHELGHFLAAKWRGVRVLRFSLGFGPKIAAFVRGETEYRISWIPLGGYVQMAGDAPGEQGEMPTGREEFLSHPWLGRIIIAAGGPLANLVGAFIVLVITGVVGVSYPDFPNRLGATPDTSVAYRVGLREGDHIVALGSRPVTSWVGIFSANEKVPARNSVVLGVERAGRRFDLALGADRREPVLSSLRRVPDPPVVGNVITGMPAYKAGLRDGDRIVAVDGQPIRAWDELPVALRGKVDRQVKLGVQRDGRIFDLEVKPINADGGAGHNGVIGIEPPRHGTYVERHSLWESIPIGFEATFALVPAVYHQMWLTISHPIYYREYLGGPVFIAQAASEQARRGLDSWLQLLAWISVAIMAFNLLPLPILDGGHITLALLEAVRRHALSANTYLRFQKAGLLLVGALFVFILANDFNRLFQRQRALDQGPRTPDPRENTVAPSPP